MEDWHVSESDSDQDGGDESGSDGAVEIAGLKIRSEKMLELFKAIEAKSLRLECLSDVRRKERARWRRPRRGSRDKVPSPAKAAEDVSETVSEIRSTTSTECRDPRR